MGGGDGTHQILVGNRDFSSDCVGVDSEIAQRRVPAQMLHKDCCGSAWAHRSGYSGNQSSTLWPRGAKPLK